MPGAGESGGDLKKESCYNVVKEAKGFHPKNAPDDTITRGSGPLFRAKGGAVEEEEEREEKKTGGRIGRKKGGFVPFGKGKRPNMGRPGRAGGGHVKGGGAGSDLRPRTSADTPKPPKQRHIMPESAKTP